MDRMNMMEDRLDTLSSAPGSFESLPDEVLEEEWRPFKLEINSDSDTIPVLHFVLHDDEQEA